MPATSISLGFVFEGCVVRLAELTGHDERRLAGTTTVDAIALLDPIVTFPSREGASLRVQDLVAADRDRLLAALYRETFGDRIENILRCEGCSVLFDIHFSLGELAASVESHPLPSGYVAVGPRLFETAGGKRFRLPTGQDECAVAAIPAERAEADLIRRCVEETESSFKSAELQAALDEVAPLLEFDLRATCPECARAHLVQFDIQTYLLRALLQERENLTGDLHRLARAYGWTPSDILGLQRTERRRLVALIETETGRRRASR